MTLNQQFMETFSERIIAAIIETSIVDPEAEHRVAMIQAAEMIETFVTIIAVLARDSVMTETPTKTREYTDRLARRLRARIAEAKREPAMFTTIAPQGEH